MGPSGPGSKPPTITKPLNERVRPVKGPNILAVGAVSVLGFLSSPVLTSAVSYTGASISTPYVTNKLPGLPKGITLTPEQEKKMRVEVEELNKIIWSREKRQQELGGGLIVGPVLEWLEKGGPNPDGPYLNTLRTKRRALSLQLAAAKSIENSELVKWATEMRDVLVFWFLFILFTIYLKQHVDNIISMATEKWKRDTRDGKVNQNLNEIIKELEAHRQELEAIKARQIDHVPKINDMLSEVENKLVFAEGVERRLDFLLKGIAELESKLKDLQNK